MFDGNAYSLSTTYHAGTGTLQMYAHHVLPSVEDPLRRVEYYMTQIDGWQLTGNIKSFRRGAAAYRNARDLSKEFRDDAIPAATSRLSNESHHDNVEDLSDWQNAHDLLQNQITDHGNSSNDESDIEDNGHKEIQEDKEDTEDTEEEDIKEQQEVQLSLLESQQTMGKPANNRKRASSKIS